MLADPIRITRLSRSSWFRFDYQDITIHVDPGFGGLFESLSIDPGLFEKKADLVLVSHVHQDHIREEALRHITKAETTFIASASCKDVLPSKTIWLKPNEHQTFQGIRIEGVYAYNTPEGRSTKKYHPKHDYLGFILSIGEKRIYFAGDTDVIPEMHDFKKIDVAMVPIGGTYVMDKDEAMDALKIIMPSIAIPMHQAHEELKHFKDNVEKTLSIQTIPMDINEFVVI